MANPLDKPTRNALRQAAKVEEYAVAVPADQLLALLDAADREEAMRAVLREVEWGGIDDNGPPACPVCGEAKRRGHASDCALSAALKGGWS